MIKHIELVNKDGRVLRGYLCEPENFTGELVVMFHGFTGNKTEHAGHFRTLSRMLDKEGIGSLRLDFSGNGESDGEFTDFTFDTMIPEAKQMVEFALNYPGVKKVDLLGFSMGGAVAGMMSSVYLDKINKVVLWSPAGQIVEHIKQRYEARVKDEQGNAIGGAYSLSKAMYESLDKYDVYKGLENFKNRVFIVQGFKDQAVPYITAMKYATTYPNAHVHIVNTAGHGYDALEEMNELYSKTMAFFKQ